MRVKVPPWLAGSWLDMADDKQDRLVLVVPPTPGPDGRYVWLGFVVL